MLKHIVLAILVMPLFTGFSRLAPEVHTVEIKGMKFVPAEIVVKNGDVVVWVNNDMVVHTITAETTKVWTSPVIPVGKSWKITVRQNFRYFCSLHPVMKGAVQVR